MVKKLISNLKKIESQYPQSVINEIKIGDTVRRDNSNKYLIDEESLNILERLKNDSFQKIPYFPIYSNFKNDSYNINDVFKKSNDEVCLSKILEKKMGGSLEKAILTQLAAQDEFESFLINGNVLLKNSEIVPFFNSFNLIVLKNDLFLYDTNNPVIGDKGVKPYIVPVLSINNMGEIITEAFEDEDRSYFIF